MHTIASRPTSLVTNHSPLATHSHPAAVEAGIDVERLAGDAAREVAGEEDGHVADFVGRGDAA